MRVNRIDAKVRRHTERIVSHAESTLLFFGRVKKIS
jgi:hypothetical protein